MPQYELMYLLGSQVADPEIPAITSQILKFVEDFGGTNIKETQLGKKKLAYPIKKTRNGHYVVVNFEMDAKKINEFDAKIRTQENTVIRYLLTNIDEHLARIEKDKIEQAKLSKRSLESPGNTNLNDVPVRKERIPTPKLQEIDSAALDKKIEEALGEDIL
jgi:small subunit ribosomal protein S6